MRRSIFSGGIKRRRARTHDPMVSFTVLYQGPYRLVVKSSRCGLSQFREAAGSTPAMDMGVFLECEMSIMKTLYITIYGQQKI